MSAEQEIYYKELARRGSGHPIYEPNPGDLYDTVRVGDVGFVTRRGLFYRVFNIFAEKTDPINDNAPDDFVPLDARFKTTSPPSYRSPGAIMSSHITSLGGGIGASATVLPAGTNIKFQAGKREGAILLTRYVTLCHDAIHELALKNYMLRNYKSWFWTMRETLQLPVDEPSDMLLVTGCDLTADWATAVFFESSRECSIDFTVTEPISSASGSVSFNCSRSTSASQPYRCGPPHSFSPTGRPIESDNNNSALGNAEPKYNQCTFIRSYRVRERFLLPAKLIAGAEPLDPEMGKSDDALTGVPAIESTSDGIEDFRKVLYDAAFNYIFENSEADVAIIHDGDIGEIMKLVGDDSDELSMFNALFRKKREVLSYLDEELQLRVGVFTKPEGCDQSVVEETSTLHRAALDLCPTGHPNRSSSLNNLANAVKTRFEQRGRPEDLDESIELFQAALDLRPTGHLHRSLSLKNLVNAVKTRFVRRGRSEDLDESIIFHRAALELRPTGYPGRSKALRGLALSMHEYFLWTANLEYLEECMRLFGSAALHEFSGTLNRLQIAVQWANTARLHNHASAIRAYQVALSLLQRTLSISPTLQMQHDLLIGKKGNATLALDAASYAIDQGDLKQAIEMLEQGRGLVWSQMRGFRTPAERLSGVEEELVDRFLSTSLELEALSMFHQSKPLARVEQGLPTGGQNTLDQLLPRKQTLVNELDRTIEKIRTTEGFEDFLRAPRFSTLQKAAMEGPVIVVIHSRFRSDALIVLRDVPPVCVELDSDLHTHGPRYLRKLKDVLPKVREQPGEVDEVLKEVLKFLWDTVVARVVAKLDELGIEKQSRIWWCPTSFLSGLPFHAAGPVSCEDGEEKYLPDFYISSYTPTLGALIEARSRTTARAAGRPSVLVVAQTNSLPSVRKEIKEIKSAGESTALVKSLEDTDASPEAVLGALREKDGQPEWIHFACHGHLDLEKHFHHYFQLSKSEHTDGRLTLRDIMATDLRNAEFAFLSACHSAEQHVDSASEEVIHLAAAVQFSGFRGVIGTMWKPADVDGPWIAKRFYKSMFDEESLEKDGFKGAARVLNSVTRGLRDLGPRKGMTLERWVNLVHVGV